MNWYRCNICGCYLDPGEKCDCQDEKNRYKDRIDRLTQEEGGGQMVLKEVEKHGATARLR